MLPITPNGAPTPATTQTEPELKDRTTTPRGVLQKNLKTMVYVGVVLLLVVAMFVSSSKKKSTAPAPVKDAAPAPQVQDNTANNVQAFHTQLDTERQQRQQQEASLAAAAGTPTQRAAAASYGATGQPVPCVPDQVCNPSAAYAANGGQQQLSPEQQQIQQLAAKERERHYASSFESNIVYSHAAPEAQPATGQGSAPSQANPHAASTQPAQPTSFIAARQQERNPLREHRQHR